MPLPVNSPFSDIAAQASTASIATSPASAVAVAPASGYVRKAIAAAAGAFTGTVAVAVSINGSADIFGGNFQLPAQTGPAHGAVAELSLVGDSSVFVNEGDVITFTPSGGAGASIAGAFTLMIRKAG
jgi:hypothetical protein